MNDTFKIIAIKLQIILSNPLQSRKKYLVKLITNLHFFSVKKKERKDKYHVYSTVKSLSWLGDTIEPQNRMFIQKLYVIYE